MVDQLHTWNEQNLALSKIFSYDSVNEEEDEDGCDDDCEDKGEKCEGVCEAKVISV